MSELQSLQGFLLVCTLVVSVYYEWAAGSPGLSSCMYVGCFCVLWVSCRLSRAFFKYVRWLFQCTMSELHALQGFLLEGTLVVSVYYEWAAGSPGLSSSMYVGCFSVLWVSCRLSRAFFLNVRWLFLYTMSELQALKGFLLVCTLVISVYYEWAAGSPGLSSCMYIHWLFLCTMSELQALHGFLLVWTLVVSVYYEWAAGSPRLSSCMYVGCFCVLWVSCRLSRAFFLNVRWLFLYTMSELQALKGFLLVCTLVISVYYEWAAGSPGLSSCMYVGCFCVLWVSCRITRAFSSMYIGCFCVLWVSCRLSKAFFLYVRWLFLCTMSELQALQGFILVCTLVVSVYYEWAAGSPGLSSCMYVGLVCALWVSGRLSRAFFLYVHWLFLCTMSELQALHSFLHVCTLVISVYYEWAVGSPGLSSCINVGCFCVLWVSCRLFKAFFLYVCWLFLCTMSEMQALQGFILVCTLVVSVYYEWAAGSPGLSSCMYVGLVCALWVSGRLSRAFFLYVHWLFLCTMSELQALQGFLLVCKLVVSVYHEWAAGSPGLSRTFSKLF